MDVNSKPIAFINPYDIKGGASLGTYRLFSYFYDYISSDVSLQVIVKLSSDRKGIFGLSYFLRLLFYFQIVFNKILCSALSRTNLPVAFTFFVPFSLPALILYLKTQSASSIYLHSMSSGFSCPLTFYLLFSRASVVKTADDWYLTGGCHYSLDCDQWMSGCKSCPFMNPFGKFVVRLNWILKRWLIHHFTNFTFVSPSKWLSSRYSYHYPSKCSVIFNSASYQSTHSISEYSDNDISFIPKNNILTLGLPVTYLRDKRKGFYDALPVIVEALESFPVRIVLCGGDSDRYLNLIKSRVSQLHRGSSFQSMGFLSPSRMKLFYAEVDFVLHFAKFDNSPNIITESLCANVPVICLDHSGSPEHVRASTAGFVLSDISELLTILSSIVKKPVDLSLLKRRAYYYSKSVLSPEAMAKSYSQLFL